jgi:hypothetical protein
VIGNTNVDGHRNDFFNSNGINSIQLSFGYGIKNANSVILSLLNYSMNNKNNNYVF